MSTDIIRLCAGDFEQAMDFLNEVFAEHAPHDFANLLPSIYQPTDEAMRCNYAVREAGRLAAVVGSFPIDWRVGDIPLKMAGIGGVAVHKDFRGKGYMKLLMNRAVEDMPGDGVALSYLGGRRQRYAYFGYEVGGCKFRLNFNRDNIRHALGDAANAISFEPVTGDPETNAQLAGLCRAQPIYCQRPIESFHRYLKSWHFVPMAALDASGEVVGYLTAFDEGKQVNELVARDADTAAVVIGAWVNRVASGSVTLRMQGPVGPVLRRLCGFAETASLDPSGNWRVFDFRPVLDTLLKVKHQHEPLPAGDVTISITDLAQSVRLVVDDEGARCESCDAEADLTVDSLKAVPLLFGPLQPPSVMPLPDSARLLSAWCPLPLGISPQDKV